MKTFREGEVVHLTDGSYGKLVRGNSSKLFDSNGITYIEGAKDAWYFRAELQKLTKTERGG